MIKSVEFKNFRNIGGKYIFNNNLIDEIENHLHPALVRALI